MNEGKEAMQGSSDAIQMLKDDHAKIESLFNEYLQTDDHAAAEDIVAQVCTALEIHTKLEEEIFYPAARSAINDDDLMDEAEDDHREAKGLVDDLRKMDADDDDYDSTFQELIQGVSHHIKEEEGDMFPRVRQTSLDLIMLGKEMAARKNELTQENPLPASRTAGQGTRPNV